MNWKHYLLLTVFIFAIALYFIFDPATNVWFPKCPLKVLTGYDCPGCGSQRAVHHLLHLEFSKAFAMNALLVLSLPYVLFGLVYQNTSLKKRWPNVHNYLFGNWAIYFWTVAVLAWWVYRNVV